ncbi:succinate dehydrogenase, cytochrome b556 subunit [Halioglobus japonicus]|uniref:Succinate dehydrogenase cytochrome b556 subunit n=1 Tax=Halioglobus japonicus TaxID=930805 RepID=A0AAP8MC46_9GAMM|nr:succinate dehydrogenase, cytochrome b556 subunit [Halioglobus japonicus]AQA16991.1 succinate dehydrogenase, cytochrome b556 subunit [Halioglobus japonicus]PLW84877.1 succinate dehydrogenase, cytochrome b556 subunit [Halioglobus japonicus]GHD21920.1 succinate dehydrogenase cytochrome b556 large subunit [Halioglobus japonicus]
MTDSRPVDRPVNLDLATMKFPITATASILHRVSAVVIWVGFAFALYLLWTIQASPEGYASVAAMFADSFLAKFFAWGFLTALGYYCMGGLKHIIQEMGYFEEFESGQKISWLAIGLGIVLSVVMGVVIWA